MLFFEGEQRTELEQGESDTHREHLEGCWGFQHDDDDCGGGGGGDDDDGVWKVMIFIVVVGSQPNKV